MQAHYTSILDLSDDALEASEKGYNRLMEALVNLENLKTGKSSDFDVAAWQQKCYDAMNDDFNTPILIAHLFDAVKHINLIKEDQETITEADRSSLEQAMKAFVYDVLGVENQTLAKDDSNALSGVMDLLIQIRNEARANKDFATSDKIRDELGALGIQLKDGKDGTSFSIN